MYEKIDFIVCAHFVMKCKKQKRNNIYTENEYNGQKMFKKRIKFVKLRIKRANGMFFSLLYVLYIFFIYLICYLYSCI